jgi:hypothetical protein
VLGDVWRVSELTDLTIHHLWQKYRDNVGCNPSFRVIATAKRTAHSLEDPGARVHLSLNISLDTLEEYRDYALIRDTGGTEGAYGTNIDLRRFEAKLRELGKKDEFEVYRMLKAGYYWYEIGQRLGRTRIPFTAGSVDSSGASLAVCNALCRDRVLAKCTNHVG